MCIMVLYDSNIVIRFDCSDSLHLCCEIINAFDTVVLNEITIKIIVTFDMPETNSNHDKKQNIHSGR